MERALSLTTKGPQDHEGEGDTDFTDDHGFSGNPSVKIRAIRVSAYSSSFEFLHVPSWFNLRNRDKRVPRPYFTGVRAC